MQYFKNNNNNVFAYDDEQVAQGYASDKTPMTDEEVQLHLNPPKTEEQIKAEINNAIHALLDFKAQEYRYDNMMSARSYAGYDNPFQSEAQTLAIWASNCWVKAGEIEAEVLAGNRDVPTADEVIAEMPILD